MASSEAERQEMAMARRCAGPALAGSKLFESGFFICLAISSVQTGFSRFGLFQEILLEMFVELGANWKIKSLISAEIRGIGARKFVAM
jgi:hypothetical protein